MTLNVNSKWTRINHLISSEKKPYNMMTSSNGNFFRVTGPLCGVFTGHRWILHHKGLWLGALFFSLICAWINDKVNNREAADLRRHRADNDVIVIKSVVSRTPHVVIEQGQGVLPIDTKALPEKCWFIINKVFTCGYYTENIHDIRHYNMFNNHNYKFRI